MEKDTRTEKQMKKEDPFTNSTINRSKEELLKIINDWDKEKDQRRRSKIVSLLTFAKKWNVSGGGPKTRINNLTKTIRGLEIIMRRTPNDTVKDLLSSYKTELEELKNEIKETENDDLPFGPTISSPETSK